MKILKFGYSRVLLVFLSLSFSFSGASNIEENIEEIANSESSESNSSEMREIFEILTKDEIDPENLEEELRIELLPNYIQPDRIKGLMASQLELLNDYLLKLVQEYGDTNGAKDWIYFYAQTGEAALKSPEEQHMDWIDAILSSIQIVKDELANTKED